MTGNRLLDSLPADLRLELERHLITVKLPTGAQLLEDKAEIKAVHFPTTCMASSMLDFKDDRSIESHLIGNDGFTGLATYFGSPIAPQKVIVQVPGEALEMDVQILQRFLEEPRMRDVVGLYTARMLRVAGWSAGCLVFHPMEQRLARWLLMVQDAIERDEFPLTQEFIGIMLGSHRPTVTIAEGILTKAGLVERRRGALKLLDREGLEAASCECYEAQKLEI